jgi:hypothetical protein
LGGRATTDEARPARLVGVKQRLPVRARARVETERSGSALSSYAGGQHASPTPDFPIQERYEGIYRERRRECGWQLYDAVGVAGGDRESLAFFLAVTFTARPVSSE